MGQKEIKCDTCRCLVEVMIHSVFYYFCWDTSEILEKNDLLKLHNHLRPTWCERKEPYTGNFKGFDNKLCTLTFLNARGE